MLGYSAIPKGERNRWEALSFWLRRLARPAQLSPLLRGLQWFPTAPGLSVPSLPLLFRPAWVPGAAQGPAGSGRVCRVLQALPSYQEEATNANYGARESLGGHASWPVPTGGV